MIPKIIHQTVRRKDQLPRRILENVQFLIRNNPGWVHHLYDDFDIDEFIKANYRPDVYSIYKSINPEYGAAKADLFRYLLISKVGGVYLDIKSTIRKPLDSILLEDDRYILANWENRPGDFYQDWGIHPECPPPGEFQQWHIISEPSHPYLSEVLSEVFKRIESYDTNIHGVGFFGVIRTTGPIPYTLAIKKVLRESLSRLISVGDFGLQYSIVAGEGIVAHHKLFNDPTYHFLKKLLIIRPMN